MNFKTGFLSVLTLVILFFIGREDWMMLLPIPLGILNGYINSFAISKMKVGKVYHRLQFGILVAAMATLRLFYVVQWDEIPLLTILYYIAFEVSLNKFRGLAWDSIGMTAFTDRFLVRFMLDMVNFKTWFRNRMNRIANIFRKKSNKIEDVLYRKLYSVGQVRTLFTVTKLALFFAGISIYLANKPL